MVVPHGQSEVIQQASQTSLPRLLISMVVPHGESEAIQQASQAHVYGPVIRLAFALGYTAGKSPGGTKVLELPGE